MKIAVIRKINILTKTPVAILKLSVLYNMNIKTMSGIMESKRSLANKVPGKISLIVWKNDT